MKTRSKFYSLFFVAAAFGLMASCSGSGSQEHSDDANHDHEHASGSSASEEAGAPQFQVDEKFQEQLAGVFASYVELKDALVASDSEKVKAEAAETKESLAKADMALLTGAAHNDWMNYLQPMENSLAEIANAADIEEQRKSFSTLSDNLYKSAKAFGLGGKEAFYEYCPMAFNNEGAYWLSDNDQIRNPYFGDKMLKCGEVKEKLR